MLRKYSVEFREKAVIRSLKWSAWSPAHYSAPENRSASPSAYHAIHCGRGTATVPPHEMDAQRRIAKQWKKSSSVCAERTVN